MSSTEAGRYGRHIAEVKKQLAAASDVEFLHLLERATIEDQEFLYGVDTSALNRDILLRILRLILTITNKPERT